jgi:hypothetical protein
LGKKMEVIASIEKEFVKINEKQDVGDVQKTF